MHFLIVYGSTEGHTRELAHFAAQRLREHGHQAAVEEATDKAGGADPRAYDGTILAASVHVGRYQPVLVRFAREHHEALNAVRSAFISVSLSAAGEKSARLGGP